MRLDLISPPRLDLLEAGVGRSAASWGITTGPKLRACLSNQHRLCCVRSVLNLLYRWSSSRPCRRGLANTAVGRRFKRITQSSLLPHSEGSLCCPVSLNSLAAAASAAMASGASTTQCTGRLGIKRLQERSGAALSSPSVVMACRPPNRSRKLRVRHDGRNGPAARRLAP
jgi:hypothetical protein